MNNNYYKVGSYNICCPRCGQKYKRGDCQKEWTGQLVCVNCYDSRHPETYPLPSTAENIAVPDARPRPPVLMVDAPEGLSVWGKSYLGIQGLDHNLTWNNWTETWNGDADSDNFYIGS